jgi:hypothetical protein
MDARVLDRELTWLRVSIVPGKPLDQVRDLLLHLCLKLPEVDIGVSQVVDDLTDLDVSEAICGVVEDSQITHIRFVQEIFGLPETMSHLVDRCSGLTTKAVYQWRNEHRPGMKSCYMARLKPVIAASGLVFPCCGVQYAAMDARALPSDFAMGHWSLYGAGSRFDGSRCRRCYYWQYNTVLGRIVEPVDHEDFL